MSLHNKLKEKIGLFITFSPPDFGLNKFSEYMTSRSLTGDYESFGGFSTAPRLTPKLTQLPV
jgi:hypothetical protein